MEDDIRGQAAHGATDPVNDEQSAPRARTVRQATGNRTGRAMKDGRQQQDGETFRDFLDRLRAAGELVDLTQPVDIRHIATLVDQSDKALMFHDVIGYDMPVVSGIIRSQKRAIMSMGCATYPEIEAKLKAAIDAPVSPERVETSSTLEVIQTGDDVDLYALPIPMSSVHDGGPMITAGIVISRDPEYGMNSGIYRFMVKERNLTGIDIVTPNNMRLFAQRAYEAGRPLPISISIGNHPYEIMGSGFRAPLGMDEMAIAGGHPRHARGAWRRPDHRRAAYRRQRDRARGRDPADGLGPPRGSLRRVHPAHGRLALEPACAGEVRAAPQGCGLLRAPHAVGKHLACGADPLHRHPAGAEDRWHQRQGHQCHAGRLRLLARRHLDPQAGGRGQERAARRAVGDGHQACRGRRRGYRRLRCDRRGMGHRQRAFRATGT